MDFYFQHDASGRSCHERQPQIPPRRYDDSLARDQNWLRRRDVPILARHHRFSTAYFLAPQRVSVAVFEKYALRRAICRPGAGCAAVPLAVELPSMPSSALEELRRNSRRPVFRQAGSSTSRKTRRRVPGLAEWSRRVRSNGLTPRSSRGRELKALRRLRALGGRALTRATARRAIARHARTRPRRAVGAHSLRASPPCELGAGPGRRRRRYAPVPLRGRAVFCAPPWTRLFCGSLGSACRSCRFSIRSRPARPASCLPAPLSPRVASRRRADGAANRSRTAIHPSIRSSRDFP